MAVFGVAQLAPLVEYDEQTFQSLNAAGAKRKLNLDHAIAHYRGATHGLSIRNHHVPPIRFDKEHKALPSAVTAKDAGSPGQVVKATLAATPAGKIQVTATVPSPERLQELFIFFAIAGALSLPQVVLLIRVA